MYIPPEVIIEARKMDLLTYLKNYEPYELVRFSGNTYTTRTHDSLKISNGKWMWWSRGIGGRSALDYLVKVKGLSFHEAVETITGYCAVRAPVYEKQVRHEETPLLLPEKSSSTDQVYRYLLSRGIDGELIRYCLEQGLIMESLPYHNVVFIGYDNENQPKYAAYRSTNSQRIMGDCTGSKKEYSFRLTGKNQREVHLFESAIDLLSYATLCRKKGVDFRNMNLVSLAGVYATPKNIEDSKVPAALTGFLKSNPGVKTIILHLDNDHAGRCAAKALQFLLADQYEVVDDPPPKGKDFNDFLLYQKQYFSKNQSERSAER